MSAQSTPIGMDLSPEAERRNNMVLACWDRLQHFAFRCLYVRHQRNDQWIVVCIQVDSQWRYIVDELMPGADWQLIRNQGQEPIARGTASFSICNHLTEVLPPHMKESLLEIPQPGKMKCVALDEGGCTVYDIEPVEQQ